MKYTRREEGMLDEFSLVLIYNGIKYMSGFDVTEGVTGKIKMFEKLS